MSTEKNIFESGKRFSESYLWKLQRKFFEEQGINAWKEKVPFYITSNPFIGNAYAQVIINYYADLANQNTLDLNSPCYVLELGTGSGKFSYYCMLRIFELQKQLGLEHIKICYVMTDFTNSNLKFWKTHPRFEPYLNKNKLDFAIFDMTSSDNITLVNSGNTLDKKSIKNPICLLANYIFDTIPHDAFHVQDGKVFELQPVLRTSKELSNKDEITLDDLVVYFNKKPIKPENYYQDSRLNQLIKQHVKKFKNTSFLIPIETIKCIARMMEASNNRMLLISTDKGYSYPFEMEYRSDPHVSIHGSFSMMVNFFAIAEFFKLCKGDAYLPSPRQSIETCLFTIGNKFKEYIHTIHAIDNNIERFGPGDFFNLHNMIKNNKEFPDAATMVSHLSLSLWDPRIFNLFIENILQELKTAGDKFIQSLLSNIDTIEKNIFHMPGTYKTYFDIARLYQAINRYEEAIKYYQKSIELYGKDYEYLYNAGICYHHLKNTKKALTYFKNAEKLHSNAEIRKKIQDLI